MYAQLITNIGVNFKFYRRNRLLLVAAILIIFVLVLSSIPSLFFITKTKHLEIISMIFSRLSNFAIIITAAIGLLFVSHHIMNRSTKMVFTKPCLPEVWLLSSFLSATLVSLTLYAGIFFICSVLFIVWDIPFQWGLLYITFNEFLQTIIIISYITFLTVLFHPVIVLLFMFIFQEGTFYNIKLLLMSGIKVAGEGSASILRFLKGFVDIIYMILPTFSPYAEKTEKIYSSFRASSENWEYLGLTFIYTLSIAALFYFLAAYFLKKKRHI